jgi:hypothetical protein
MEIAMFLPIAAGQFCLLSYWLTVGIWAFPSGFPIPFQNCPKTFQQPLAISQRLSYAILAVPPTAFKSISQQLLAKTWQSPSLLSERPHFCGHFLKFEGAFQNLKNTSGSSPRTDLSNNISFNQSQCHATTPLNPRHK